MKKLLKSLIMLGLIVAIAVVIFVVVIPKIKGGISNSGNGTNSNGTITADTKDDIKDYVLADDGVTWLKDGTPVGKKNPREAYTMTAEEKQARLAEINSESSIDLLSADGILEVFNPDNVCSKTMYEVTEETTAVEFMNQFVKTLREKLAAKDENMYSVASENVSGYIKGVGNFVGSSIVDCGTGNTKGVKAITIADKYFTLNDCDNTKVFVARNDTVKYAMGQRNYFDKNYNSLYQAYGDHDSTNVEFTDYNEDSLPYHATGMASDLNFDFDESLFHFHKDYEDKYKLIWENNFLVSKKYRDFTYTLGYNKEIGTNSFSFRTNFKDYWGFGYGGSNNEVISDIYSTSYYFGDKANNALTYTGTSTDKQGRYLGFNLLNVEIFHRDNKIAINRGPEIQYVDNFEEEFASDYESVCKFAIKRTSVGVISGPKLFGRLSLETNQIWESNYSREDLTIKLGDKAQANFYDSKKLKEICWWVK